MAGKRLREHLLNRDHFTIITELCGGPGYNLAPIKTFLTDARASQNQDIPAGFDWVGITLPQSPGGVANVEPADVLSAIKDWDLQGDLDIIPHVTCKDHNANALKSALIGYQTHGIESILALTGDKPLGARGVFEMESVCLLGLIQQMNNQALLKAKAEQWDDLPRFYSGAAVSPFKYTEASQMQQYFKMLKKITCGAEFLITQLGWDWRKSQELMHFLEDQQINIPVIGNVYLLTTQTPAPRLMHSGKLPGCYVSDELMSKLKSENFNDHIERAAQQVAMYRALGAAGVDIGGLPDYSTLIQILQRAADIGSGWTQYKDNLCWPRAHGFYLYDEEERSHDLSSPKPKLRQKSFNLAHRTFFNRQSLSTRTMKKMLQWTKADRENSFSHKQLAAWEKTFKFMAFKCEDCGDCYLPENFGYCTLGGCAKGLSNAPCGDSTVDGMCGNNTEARCTGELIYEAAASQPHGRERLCRAIHAPRDPALRNSPSWINFLFGRDHTRPNTLLTISAGLNANDPGTRLALDRLVALSNKAFTFDSGALRYLKALIQEQTRARPDYIRLCLDALDDHGEQAQQLIAPMIDLIQRTGRGIPVCIDSRFESVISTGLQAWYQTEPTASVPMVRWSEPTLLPAVLAQKQETPFHLCAPLLNGEMNAQQRCKDWISDLSERGRDLVRQAVKTYGFQPQDIVLECKVLPLARDIQDNPDVPSHTHIIFETIKQLKQQRQTQGVRCAVNVDQAALQLPRKIGVCRAYTAVAMDYGLDACMADAERHYGESPADANLMALVRAYAEADGSAQRTQDALDRMHQFCPPKKPASSPPQSTTTVKEVPAASSPKKKQVPVTK